MRPWKLTCTAILALLTSVASVEARDEDPEAAIALFDEGRGLVAVGRVAEACEKFTAANYLAPSLPGIELNLADCWERVGRTASAWLTFQHVSTGLDPKRAAYADAHARALEPAITWLQITLDPSWEGNAIVIRLDGIEVQPADVLPLDPGTHYLDATRPGARSWKTTVTAESPGTTVVVVPPLPLIPDAAPLAMTQREQKLENARPPHETLVAGLAVGGAAGLAVTVTLVLIAKSQYEHAVSDHCTTGLTCDPTGVDAIHASQLKGTIATVTAGAGIAALITAAVLRVTEPPPKRAGKPGMALRPQFRAGSAALSVEGGF